MIVVLGLLAAVAIPANAAYWTDNFDTGEAVDNEPINWTVWGTTTATALISTEDVYSSTPNAVKQHDNDSTGQVSMFRYFTESEGGTLSLDFKNPTAYFSVILYNGNKDAIMTVFSFWYNGWQYNDDGVVKDQGSHSPWITHWSRLTIEWTDATATAKGTYSATVADLEATDSRTVTGTFDNVGSAGCIYLKTAGSGNRWTYIDDVVVTPEPATMVLLGLGGVGLLVRRRRRA